MTNRVLRGVGPDAQLHGVDHGPGVPDLDRLAADCRRLLQVLDSTRAGRSQEEAVSTLRLEIGRLGNAWLAAAAEQHTGETLLGVPPNATLTAHTDGHVHAAVVANTEYLLSLVARAVDGGTVGPRELGATLHRLDQACRQLT